MEENVMSKRKLRGVSLQLPTIIRDSPTTRTIGGRTYLVPPSAQVRVGENGEEEVYGERITARAHRHGDPVVLAVPTDPHVLDQFVSVTSTQSLYHLVHVQKWMGVLVPHDAHTQAAERGDVPYADYVQAVTFAKVTGVMKHPDTGETVSCAVLNVRMPRETYGGQLWWLIGGHNIPHGSSGVQESGAYLPCVSSLGGTLTKEGKEEALVIRTGNTAATPFDPRERGKGRKLRVLGYGRSSDAVGQVHESAVVAVHLATEERLVVRDRRESLGFIQVPLAAWMRFMDGAATLDDQRLIRASVVQGLDDEMARVPASESAERRALIERQLTAFFGEPNEDGERAEFHLTSERNTPPIDRLSLRATQALAQRWELIPACSSTPRLAPSQTTELE
jgi:hypothetical protein